MRIVNTNIPPPKNGKTYLYHLVDCPSTKRSQLIQTFKNIAYLLNNELSHHRQNNKTLHGTPDISEADIFVSFGKNAHLIHTPFGAYPCQFNFDGEGGTLAHAWSLAQNHGGQLHLDDSEDWTKFDNYSIILHELFHVFNIDHSDNPDSLMYPRYLKPYGSLTDYDRELLRMAFSDIKINFWKKVKLFLKKFFILK